MPQPIKLKACAKLNLCLEVLGKRSDGYHDISSVFHQVDLCDELEFTAASDGRITLTCDDPRLPVNEKNLVVKAARLLQAYAKGAVIPRKDLALQTEGCIDHPSVSQTRSNSQDDNIIAARSNSRACTETDNLPCQQSGNRLPGAMITLTKRIPVGAGLGGGSADGAAALIGLSKLWKMALKDEDLHKLALTLGSDVPYFLSGGTALVSGRGEHVEIIKPGKKYHFVIVYPGFGVSTTWAYKSLKNQLTKAPEYSKILTSIWTKGPEVSAIAGLMHNDLEDAVIPSHPVIARIKEQLKAQGAASAMMSGSGSSVFGIFPDEDQARKVHEKLRQEYPKSFYAHSLI